MTGFIRVTTRGESEGDDMQQRTPARINPEKLDSSLCLLLNSVPVTLDNPLELLWIIHSNGDIVSGKIC